MYIFIYIYIHMLNASATHPPPFSVTSPLPTSFIRVVHLRSRWPPPITSHCQLALPAHCLLAPQIVLFLHPDACAHACTTRLESDGNMPTP